MKSGATRVPCLLRAAALASPGAPAVVGRGGTLTYGELDLQVTIAAEEIEKLGFKSGTRVALHLPEDERYLVLLLALIRAGCIVCPLSTRLPPRGVAPLLQEIACRGLISSSEELLRTTDADIRKLRPEKLLAHEPASRDHAQDSEPLHLALDQPATIVFTSGSAGAPKAVLHTFGNHYYSALGSSANIALAPGDRWLHSLPLYHVGGLSILFRCLLAKATVVLPEPRVTLGIAITDSGITHVSLVSTQLLRLLREEDFDPGRLRAILLGGGPVPAPLVDEAITRGLPIHTSYGLTEMASQVTATPPGASPEELHTSGRLLPYREISISDDGEILVKGKTLFSGYVTLDIEDRSLDMGGWFRTGDLGELDADGYLLLRGRKDNLFISGGENVQPEEIEEALCRLEGVEEAVVVPVPDMEFGFRPVAFVRMVEGAAMPGDLARALELHLPRFKIPVSFHGWPEEVGGMKVDRAFFRERARRLLGEGRG
jgi:O-succinylbenzoic acid--CoA ligase